MLARVNLRRYLNYSSSRTEPITFEEEYIPGLPFDVSVYEVFSLLNDVDKHALSRVNRALNRKFASTRFDRNPLESIARLGHAELLKWDRAGPRPCVLQSSVFLEAVQARQLEAVKALVELGCPYDYSAVEEAVKNGSYKIIAYLMEKGVAMEARLFEIASKQRKLKVFEVLLTGFVPETVDVMLLAARFGNVKLMETLLAKGFKYPVNPGDKFIRRMTRSGNLEAVKWVLGHFEDETAHPDYVPRPEFITYSYGEMTTSEHQTLMAAAASRGHLHILNYFLKTIGCCKYFFYSVASQAIVKGHIETLNLCEARGESITQYLGDAWERAAEKGSIALMERGMKLDIPLSSNMYEYAVEGENFTLMKWLESKNCPMDAPDSYFSRALMNDKLKTAEYFSTKISDPKTVKYYITSAAALGSRELIKWFADGGVKPVESSLVHAIKTDQLDMVRHLLTDHEIKIQYHALTELVSGTKEHNEVLRIVANLGLKFNSEQMWGFLLDPTMAKPCSTFHLAQLHSIGLFVDSASALNAARHSRFDLLTWLYNRGCDIDYEDLASIKMKHPFDTKANYGALRQWIETHPRKPKKLLRVRPTTTLKKRPGFAEFANFISFFAFVISVSYLLSRFV